MAKRVRAATSISRICATSPRSRTARSTRPSISTATPTWSRVVAALMAEERRRKAEGRADWRDPDAARPRPRHRRRYRQEGEPRLFLHRPAEGPRRTARHHAHRRRAGRLDRDDKDAHRHHRPRHGRRRRMRKSLLDLADRVEVAAAFSPTRGAAARPSPELRLSGQRRSRGDLRRSVDRRGADPDAAQHASRSRPQRAAAPASTSCSKSRWRSSIERADALVATAKPPA